MKIRYRVALEYDSPPAPQLAPDAHDLRHWLLEALTTTAMIIERPLRVTVEPEASLPSEKDLQL